MDVENILQEKLASLPAGEHSDGLKAVRLHIQAAIRHYRRGQQNDETAFTDAVYRCNQAFEGSIKEAYRVLAAKNPDKISPADIEAFLSSSGVLRERVLAQFTNYRREWRNPSTHDYKLDFDEDEALLAIVSVAVFAIVLCDQIESKLAFFAAQSTAQPVSLQLLPTGDLLDKVVDAIKRFLESYEPNPSASSGIVIYAQTEGALAGSLSKELSIAGIKVVQNDTRQKLEVDIVAEGLGDTVAIELKVTRLPETAFERALLRAKQLIREGSFAGVAVVIIVRGTKEYSVFTPTSLAKDENIKVIFPTEHLQRITHEDEIPHEKEAH